MSEDDKKRQEFAIFAEFAKICPLGIDLKTVKQPDPPQPDIECQLKDGEGRAYELCTVVDGLRSRRNKNSTRLLLEFYHAFDSLDDDIRHALRKNYSHSLISFKFVDLLDFLANRSAITEILRWLTVNRSKGPGVIHVPDELSEILTSIRVGRGSFNGPLFQVSDAGSHGFSVMDIIRKKFLKQYKTDMELELICYFHEQPSKPSVLWEQQLQQFMRENATTSLIRRVWVYDANEQKILSDISSEVISNS
ncbi:MAG: hypothetical protein WD065_09960 [Planctomycetaceae bacterium]